MSIFSDMVEQTHEVFMDDFSIFAESYDDCLHNLENVLKRCEEKSLVLNWQKCHFIVQEGIVLDQRVSRKGIKMDKVKIKVIDKVQLPTSVKGIMSLFAHAGFSRRFIKDFSKIAKLLCTLLEHDRPFNFNENCLKTFVELKRALVTATVVVAPD